MFFEVTPTGPNPQVKMNDKVVAIDLGFGEWPVRWAHQRIGVFIVYLLRKFEPIF